LKKQAKLNKNVTESELIEIENLLNQLIEEVESD